MSIKEQAQTLVRQMTIKEKVAQLHALWLNIDDKGNLTAKDVSGMQASSSNQDPFENLKDGIGQITRPLGSQEIDPVTGIRALNRIQKFLKENTRLGIPALPHEECLSGLMARGATIFPAGINNGSTWDPALMKKVGRAIGKELYSVGSRQGLAPVLDVCRDARWGRTEECYGEDPYLAALMGSAYVEGLQNDNYPVIATLKHYVGHAFSEGGRNHAPVRIGPREMNDLFLFPFEMAIKKAKAGSVMPAYHDIDGEPLHQSQEFLNGLLRERWGFDGIIVSDYEGLSQLYKDHGTQPDMAHAAAAALLAGVDVELPDKTLFSQGIMAALEKNLLTIQDVDEAVTRHLIQKYKLGLFDNPFVDEGGVLTDKQDHAQLAEESAGKSMVLLKNEGILPLGKKEKIALIGPVADNPMAMMGGYAFPVHLVTSENKDGASPLKTLRQSMEAVYGEDLIFAEGCSILTGRPDKPAVFPGDVVLDGSQQADYISLSLDGFGEAVKAAKKADTIVLAVGDLAGLFLSGTVGEGSDVGSLTLPGVQQHLIDTILDLEKPTVIVVYSGRPYNLGRGFTEAGAVLQGWLPGEGGANATTDILTGKTNPGGKLSLSIPRSAGAMPFYYNHKIKCAGTPIQKEFGAEYPFGFGCSYTEFTITDCSLKEQSISPEGTVEISTVIQNTGEMKGDEVVQIYIRDRFARYVRPLQELKGFHRITLAPGESKKLTFCLPADLLSYTIDDMRRVVEPGTFDIMVGTSSRDISYKFQLEVTGKPRILGEEWRMETEVSIS